MRLRVFAGWRNPTLYQVGGSKLQDFTKVDWGAEWHPDFAPRPGDVDDKDQLVQKRLR